MDTSASDILARLNLEKIRNDVIWNREARGKPDPRSYDERLHEARQAVIDRISALSGHAQPEAEEAAIRAVQALLSTAKDVYTAIGVQVGEELARQAILHDGQKQSGKPREGWL